MWNSIVSICDPFPFVSGAGCGIPLYLFVNLSHLFLGQDVEFHCIYWWSFPICFWGRMWNSIVSIGDPFPFVSGAGCGIPLYLFVILSHLFLGQDVEFHCIYLWSFPICFWGRMWNSTVSICDPFPFVSGAGCGIPLYLLVILSHLFLEQDVEFHCIYWWSFPICFWGRMWNSIVSICDPFPFVSGAGCGIPLYLFVICLSCTLCLSLHTQDGSLGTVALYRVP